MKKEMLSIVIPVYNVENYVGKCIESVLNQTYKNLDIVIVNDGSTDSSYEICKKYREADKRIRLISQNNQGVVSARRNGTIAARGEYVLYVDSDDLLSYSYVEELLKEIDNGVDMVVGNSVNIATKIPNGIYIETNIKFLWENYFHDNNVDGRLWSQWAKIYRKSLADKVYCEVDDTIFYGEDVEFVFRCLLHARKVKITDITGYLYTQRNDSVSFSRHINAISNFERLYFIFLKLYEDYQLSNTALLEMKKSFRAWLSSFTLRELDMQRPIHYAYAMQNGEKFLGKRVILYGAGGVGNNFYQQMEAMGQLPVLWVDKQYEIKKKWNSNISPVSALFDVEYDYIVLAVWSMDLAKKIKRELVSKGICENKIYWKQPVMLTCQFTAG